METRDGGLANEDNFFCETAILPMLRAKEDYPAIFHRRKGKPLELFARSISSKWQKDKKVFLGLEANPKRPIGCPPGTVREKSFFYEKKITVKEPSQLEFMTKLITGEARTDDIPHTSFKTCPKPPMKIPLKVPDFAHEEEVETSKRDSEDDSKEEDNTEQDIDDKEKE